MKKRIVNVLVFIGLFCLASFALAQVKLSDPLGIGDNPNGVKILLNKIATGVGEILVALGTLMIIISAYLFMTSAGSPEKIKTAKTALIYAVIGILVGALAGPIVNSVLLILS